MAHDDDGGTPRKGKLSAFTLLTSWLFNKRGTQPAASAETEFLNTRDGYELAKFAQKAFGNDAEAQKRHEAAVDAEQAEIDALLQGTGAVPIPVQQAPVAPVKPVAPAAKPVDVAVAALEKLRADGMTVEMLAEALIIIESRDVKKRNAKSA